MSIYMKKHRKSSFTISNASILHWSWLRKKMIEKSNNQEMHLGLKLIFVCICLLMQRYPSAQSNTNDVFRLTQKLQESVIGNVWFCLQFCKTWNTLLKVHFAALCRRHIHKRRNHFYPLQVWVYKNIDISLLVTC